MAVTGLAAGCVYFVHYQQQAERDVGASLLDLTGAPFNS